MIIKDSETQDILKEYLLYADIPEYFFDEVFKYLNFLLAKNSELNLISRKLDRTTVVIEHIYDCLSGFAFFKDYESICDLGSGGGFPGILFGIVFKDKRITLVEKSPKKVLFLEEAVKELNLKNVRISLNLVDKENINSSCVTARAFKSIYEIIDFTRKYFFSGGEYLLFKGRTETIRDEIAEAQKKFKLKYDLYKIADKISDKERHLVKIGKI
ncbi:MAG TPA: 16S rRNA (guanine(527)-N(7))-methyltransferase RsmG [Spirochaetota bacterium]|nr:16S rRNA (guanine(527)-N(7))-methyltransferase RsmG [Spirochaetota bacterium]